MGQGLSSTSATTAGIAVEAPIAAPPRAAVSRTDLGRRTQIDALRAIAVLWVLADHYSPAGHGPVGWLSVSMFLLISGYLITHILVRGRDGAERAGKPVGQLIRNFYVRRALRIVPAFTLAVMLTYAVHPRDFAGSLPWHLFFQTSILLAITNSWGPPWQLSHLWTLSVQEQFYFLWPLLMVFSPRRWLPGVVAAIAAAGVTFRGGAVALHLMDTVGAYTLLPASLAAICAGAGAALLERGPGAPAWLANPKPWWLLAPLALFLWASYTPQSEALRYALFDVLWVLPLAALLLCASVGIAGPAGWLLDIGWLQYLGRISLGIYLYQWLGFEAAAKALNVAHLNYAKGPLLTLTAIALTVGFALLSWNLLEKPANNFKRLFPYR